MHVSSSQQEVLKWSAVVLMIADHLAWALLPAWSVEQVAIRSVTALAFPLYALLMGYNISVRGVDVSLYWRPLLVLLLLSQVPYALLINPARFSIAGTFLLGLLLYESLTRAERVWALRLLGVAVALLIGSYVDFGLRGVLLVVVAVAFWRGSQARPGVWQAGAWVMVAIAGVVTNPFAWVAAVAAPALFLVVRLLPVQLRRMPSRLWRLWYPVHMAVIVLVAAL